MTIHLDHTIVPVRDRMESARFLAEILGLAVKPGAGHFAQVQINDRLTFDFADDAGVGGDPATRAGLHYAFHVSDAEFDAVFERVNARGIPYGSGPFSHDDGEINTRRGGRGFYFREPSGHLLEVMTVPETGSEGG